MPQRTTLTVGISARHVHLSPEDLICLFGHGYQLHVKAPLSQPGQFAAEETVALAGPRGRLERVRILGPTRGATQVELSPTDARSLGVNPPVRLSGDHRETPGIGIEGPQGRIEIPSGVIIAWRHIHMLPTEAVEFGLQDRDVVLVKTTGDRAVIFEQVIVRVRPESGLELHIDTDEGNAAGLKNGDSVEIIGRQQPSDRDLAALGAKKA